MAEILRDQQLFLQLLLINSYPRQPTSPDRLYHRRSRRQDPRRRLPRRRRRGRRRGRVHYYQKQKPLLKE